MDPLEKKCIAASTAAHLLLAGTLFIGAAFVTSSPKAPEGRMIDYIPPGLLERPTDTGGNPPAVGLPASQPEPINRQVAIPVVPPQAQTGVTHAKAESRLTPERVVPRLSELGRSENDLPTSNRLNESRQRKPIVNTELKTRPISGSQSSIRTNAEPEFDSVSEGHRNGTRRGLARDIILLAEGFKPSRSPGAMFEGEPRGNVGGLVEYDSQVQSIFFNAWVPSDDIANDRAVTWARVTVDCSGRISMARITTPSGDDNMDQSVQKTLDKVRSMPPFPEGTRESQRTYKIKFDLTAKRVW